MASPPPQLSVSDQIRQLNDARKLVLGDVKYYSNVLKSILQIVSPSAHLDLRRWGADFLAEAFATPAVSMNEKETMQLFVLETLKDLLDDPKEDAQVLRSAIQAASSIYPLALRWMYVGPRLLLVPAAMMDWTNVATSINNSYDNMTWERMTHIKSRILKIWETADTSVRICCIKFAQRVVLAQTASNPHEPRVCSFESSASLVLRC